MSKTYLFMMLGVPGSGKSYFAENLAEKLAAVYLSSDGMRLAIFKSREETDRVYHSDNRSILNTYTFSALSYSAAAILKDGISVVYDANNNTKKERLNTAKITQDGSVVPVVIWVQTSEKMAVKRAQQRKETTTQRQLSADVAQAYVTKIAKEIESPDKSENVIKIDGTIPFEEQYESFKKQLKEISDE